jgi:hypothetical protein
VLYVLILVGLLVASVCILRLGRTLAWAWRQLVQRPAIALIQSRSRDSGETASNLAMIMAPIVAIVLLTIYSATWGRPNLARSATKLAHSLGKRHEQAAVGKEAVAPVGTGSSMRDAKTALRNVSTWQGRRARPDAGLAGGGISGAPLPGKVWSPEMERAPAAAPARAEVPGCARSAACLAESNALRAWKLCAPLIEGAAPPQHRWVRAAADMHFDAFSTDRAAASVVTYRGDGLLIRSADGLWHRRAYSCDFDADADRVLSARLLPETHRLGD